MSTKPCVTSLTLIVEDAIKNLGDADTAAVTDTDADGLIGFHNNRGMHIWNTYNLW